MSENHDQPYDQPYDRSYDPPYDRPYDQQGLLPETTRDTSGRHPVNVGHLVMGVAFLGLTGIWLLFDSGVIGSDHLRWLMPLPWLAAGVAGLLAVILTARPARRSPGGR